MQQPPTCITNPEATPSQPLIFTRRTLNLSPSLLAFVLHHLHAYHDTQRLKVPTITYLASTFLLCEALGSPQQDYLFNKKWETLLVMYRKSNRSIIFVVYILPTSCVRDKFCDLSFSPNTWHFCSISREIHGHYCPSGGMSSIICPW